MAFRIGRTYARNFATGPVDGSTNIAITGDGTALPWNLPDVGTPGINVQITPKSTGIILITGVITVKNSSENVVNISLKVKVNGVFIAAPFGEETTIDNNDDGFGILPVLAEVKGLTIGTPIDVEFWCLSSASDPADCSYVMASSSIEIQEVLAATG